MILRFLLCLLFLTSPIYAYAEEKPRCFKPVSDQAIISRNTFENILPGADWNDPSVLKVGNRYIMYASSDQNFDLNIRIYRLISKDGKKWALNPDTPVFSAAKEKDAWDRRAVETPSVIYFKGKYHMFYTGYANSHMDVTDYKIGHAVSNDGITWVRDSKPIIVPTSPKSEPNLDFNQYVTGEPGAVVFQNRIYLYFTAIGANKKLGTTLQVIGMTTSQDGINWTPPKVALEPAQSFYPRSQWIGYSTPAPIVLAGRVHLFFDVYQDNPRKQKHLQQASSATGSAPWTQDSNPIFTSDDFSWTSNEILAPTALVDGDYINLWFGGNDGKTLGIGHAQCLLK